SRRSARRLSPPPGRAGPRPPPPRARATTRCWSLPSSCARLRRHDEGWATMSGDEAMATGDVPRRRIATHALIAALCFLLGLAAMAWRLAQWQGGAGLRGVAPAPAPVPATRPAPPPPTATVERAPREAPPAAAPPAGTAAGADEPQRVIIDPEVSRRVAALERRMDDIDLQSRSAVGNADRAGGLLVAFAARRALDRGVGLGFLEGLLRQRFGRSQPRAVGMIILASQQPVTL